MSIPGGLSAQWGCAEEVTYGTPVVVDRFYEFRSESLKQDIPRIESQALRSGNRTLRSDRWGAGAKTVGGDTVFEVTNKSMGRLLKHAFGDIATTQPSVGPDPTVYVHTATPGDLLGDALTVQVGRTDTGGTTRPFTYHGCKIASWSLSATVGEIGLFTPTFVGEDEDTATGLAVASYPASLSLLTFVNATLSLAGSAASVREATVTGDNGLQSGRHRLGSQLGLEPLEGMRSYGGTIDAEFVDLAQYNRFVNGTEAALVLLFEGATISNAYKYQLKVTCNVRFDGETPTVSGAEEIRQSLPFKCVASGATADTAIKVEYQTTDATP